MNDSFRRNSGNAEWDRVLADVEADVARTHAVLNAAAATPADFRALHTPVSGNALPDVDTMPSIPDSLISRMLTLHEQIGLVRSELELAISETQAQLAAIATPATSRLRLVTGAPEPVYIDRIA